MTPELKVFPTIKDVQDPIILKEYLSDLDRESAIEVSKTIGHFLGILADQGLAHQVLKVLEGTKQEDPHKEHRDHIRLEQAATKSQLYSR